MSAEHNKIGRLVEPTGIMIIVFSMTAIISGLTVYFHIAGDTNTSSLVASIGGILIGTAITILIYIVQNRDQSKMANILREIHEINQRLEIVRISRMRTEFLRIIANFEKLKKYPDIDHEQLRNALTILQMDADAIKSDINYYLYHDILIVKKNFEPLMESNNNQCLTNEEIDRNKRIMERTKNTMFSLLGTQFSVDRFEEVKHVLGKVQDNDWIIISGRDDYKKAERLQIKLGCKLMEDEEAIKDKSKIENMNLILIGGTSVNKLTEEVNHMLPIPYVPLVEDEKGGALCSVISPHIYLGYDYYTVQAIPNYLDRSNNKIHIIAVAFGLDGPGTEDAIKKLEGAIKRREKLENNTSSELLAKVWTKQGNWTDD